jgi:hypothetical protein
MPRNSTKKAERKSKKPPLVLERLSTVPNTRRPTHALWNIFLKEKEILERMGRSLRSGDLEDVKALIEELEIADPETGSRNWTM